MPNFEAERSIIYDQIRTMMWRIEATVFGERHPITDIQMVVTGKDKGPERAPKSGWKPVQLPLHWGRFDQTTWFKLRVTIPKEMKGQCVVAQIKPRGESLVYVNGEPRQGLDERRDLLFLTEKAKGGEKFELILESVPSTMVDVTHSFEIANIAVFHPEVWELYWDIAVPYKIIPHLPENYAPRRQLLALVERCTKMAQINRHPDPAYFESVRAAGKALRKGLKEFATSYGVGALTLCGHSHIDTAWLWPVRETKRKCGRTWSSVLGLMEQYPDFHFSCSQPAQYEWAKEYFPEVYKRIKQRVKEGRWEPLGCMWVEPDLNVPSGESLVRQCLFGKRFFREEFGVDVRNAWTPDTFGYSAALPQILRKSGVESFLTTKIYWNQFTQFPYSMFHWEGLDGTRVLALMPSNYNGNPEPDQIQKQWELFKQKDRCDEFIFPFGWGDGGGGPTREMIEHGKRMANIVGMPKCSFGTVQESVDRIAKQTDLEDLPVYNGELYFELHRGCQTTQARVKRSNRKGEFLLRSAELLNTMALLHGGKYDQKEINSLWKLLLTNQFHDILPGTSLNEVYRTTDKEYADFFERGRAVQQAALASLANKIDTTGEGTPVLVFNDLPWVRDDVARVEIDLPKGSFHVVGPDGTVANHQQVGKSELLFEAAAVPPLGYAVYHVVPGASPAPPSERLTVSATSLENEYLRIKLDKFGRMTSLYDKTEQRETLPKGAKANVLQLFDDRPGNWDAWDIDFNFHESVWEPDAPVAYGVVEQGPVRAVVRIVRKNRNTTITQDITLYAGSPRLDFVTHVDWQEKWVLLKAAFPVDVRSSRATFEVQHGTLERPTHRNHEADLAKFEVPAHKWADLSEGDYGVSVLNDCKYGYDVEGNVVRISLLRSPSHPDERADQGEHDFTYSIYPHGGDWRNGTVQQGFELNSPLLAVAVSGGKGELPAAAAFASIDAENVIIDAVKKHEDSDAVIVRVYETYGQRGDVTLTFGRKPKKVTACDLMEENDAPVKHKDAQVPFYITPYEVRTFKVQF